MSRDAKSRPSFSPASRWKIGFDVVLRTLLVAAVVVMVNDLGAKFFHRFFLSPQTGIKLSSRTVAVLHALTNTVKVTVYFDSQEESFPAIKALLDEYQAVNKKLSIQVVDFVQNPGEAEKVKAQYKLTGTADKDLIIFDWNDHVKMVSGDALTQYTYEQVPNEKEREFRKKPIAFSGEKMFTAMLLALQNPQPLKAYFLQGHGEPSLADASDFGYSKFAATLQQNYLTVTNLELSGPGGVPLDCNLLIIAAPAAAFTEPELQKIDRYLSEGGRLLLLLNFSSLQRSTAGYEPITGLEPILQRWGIKVLANIAQDPENTITGQDIKVRQFGQHPVVNALADFSLQMILPRPVEKVNVPNPPANAPEVTELALSSPATTLAVDHGEPARSYSLIAAVEQKPAPGVANPRGNPRLIVAGDSVFLGNHYIEGGANRDFLNSAANWLLDRPQLLEGIGPRPVTEFRLQMTQQQRQQLSWLLLGALPGGVLCFGWLVWLVRRK